ncbi:MAG: ATP-binding protein [Christensenellaceae bacterium]|jgi:predicted AAA+ superfamily ATPase|nr:ATP-binding protein [Christensenellaceae bacterium]
MKEELTIERTNYLNKLISKKENGMIKVITGIRRCGKSYLLFEIYRQYLNLTGVDSEHIIGISLDEIQNARLRNPIELDSYIREQIAKDGKMYYIFIDELQKVADIKNPYVESENAKLGFVDVLLGLMKLKNIDLYVTGSNSKMLSSDILTEFKDRGDEIKVNPLSFSEFYNAYTGDKRYAWRDFYTYGGMPLVTTKKTHEEKSKYLEDLFFKTYITDILERYKIANDKSIIDELLNIIASAIGSLTNPTKLSNAFKSVRKVNVTASTIAKYLDYFIDAFILQKAYRYDIKGKKHIDTPLKYYFVDLGLRNAKLNFRQQEENHIMENIIYNELRIREFNVDVGIVEYNSKDEDGKSKRTQLEVDFVANKGSRRYYIQSALTIIEEEKRAKEIRSLSRISDSFTKIVIVKDEIVPWHDENGILYIGIEQFLLDENAINL